MSPEYERCICGFPGDTPGCPRDHDQIQHEYGEAEITPLTPREALRLQETDRAEALLDRLHACALGDWAGRLQILRDALAEESTGLRHERDDLQAEVKRVFAAGLVQADAASTLSFSRTVLQGAIEKTIQDMRFLAMVAGQCSVEGPVDTTSAMAAAESERATKWADELSAALTASREQDTRKR